MNITYIIGNGFDLCLGLNTRYSDFYDYYQNQPSPSEEVKQLKATIDKNKENWVDLELALGEYTSNFKDSNSATKVMEDLCDHLTEYLKIQSFLIPQSNEKLKEEMLRCLANPNEFFLPADKEQIRSYYSNRLPAHGKITILSLNYTPSIERILDYKDNQPISIDSNDSWLGYGAEVHRILHPHHTLDDTILVGLNDESQIANQTLLGDETFKENFIKPECNKMLSSGIETQCSNVINNSDLFVVFGSSLGATDKQWWQKIADRLVHSNSLLLLFIYGHNMQRTGRRLGEQKRTVIDNFVSPLEGYTDTQIEDIKRKTLVSFNSGTFDQLKAYSTYLGLEHGTIKFNYANNNGTYPIGHGDRTFTTKWSKASDTSIHAYSDASDIHSIAIAPNASNLEQIPVHTLDYSSQTRTPKIGDAVVWRNTHGYYAVTKVISIKDDSRGSDVDEVEIEYLILDTPNGLK